MASGISITHALVRLARSNPNDFVTMRDWIDILLHEEDRLNRTRAESVLQQGQGRAQMLAEILSRLDAARNQ